MKFAPVLWERLWDHMRKKRIWENLNSEQSDYPLKLPSLVVLGSSGHCFFDSLGAGGARRENESNSLKAFPILLKIS